MQSEDRVARKTVKRRSGSSDADKPAKPGGLRERLTNSTETADEHLARIDAALAHLKTETSSSGRASLQFLLQFPNEAMRERITFLAKANGRSVNAEIIDRLQRSITDTMPVNDAIAELYDRVQKLEGAVKEHGDRLNIRDNR
ncbi:MAG: Arc family DNA-binding protein [Bradyrhizobium sp.]|uniref:Arc family DNA-binding protein n=1 Tax=Bradyrhizobium sp. TaxID=376 RepID=UPI001DA2994F|nr:Arc family DNA-binding protein [Bradyrhizobium sp.]MBV9559554.1 Arc family DNA-binding protein [Bradyrhizobium sp.]